MEMLEPVLLRSPAATEIAGALSDFIYNSDAGYGGIEKQKLLLLMYIYNVVPCLFLRSSWQNSRVSNYRQSRPRSPKNCQTNDIGFKFDEVILYWKIPYSSITKHNSKRGKFHVFHSGHIVTWIQNREVMYNGIALDLLGECLFYNLIGWLSKRAHKTKIPVAARRQLPEHEQEQSHLQSEFAEEETPLKLGCSDATTQPDENKNRNNKMKK
ncbi:hypothetical protein H5410_037690 [Solanum commersonii]|uniref:Uncharacterized protein n=1 Tax=Solanum commersonii TaxID=4109 RepID=A0A9J5Y8P3_SOLCO|nr:hypothetical protein H5410_037690 [Solanum commersonii]